MASYRATPMQFQFLAVSGRAAGDASIRDQPPVKSRASPIHRNETHHHHPSPFAADLLFSIPPTRNSLTASSFSTLRTTKRQTLSPPPGANAFMHVLIFSFAILQNISNLNHHSHLKQISNNLTS